MFLLLLFLQETRTITKTVVTYNSVLTWATAGLVLAWLVWYLISRYLRAKKMRRRSRRTDRKLLKKALRVKNELSSRWLRKGSSKKIHGIGIGKLESGEYCIQIFVNDSSGNMLEDAAESVPSSYKNIPLVLIEMPQAIFLSAQTPVTAPPIAAPIIEPNNALSNFSAGDYKELIRGKHDVLMGGISGANSNLEGQCGTIGYFVRRKSFLPRKGAILLLSNSHVFVDMKRSTVEDDDLIMQPSPGEPAESRPVGSLIDFNTVKFDNEPDDANHIDAAVARLWKQQDYQPMIPMIGAVKGYVKKDDVEVGEKVRKFGRTTGFTRGSIFSVHLDIRIGYAHTASEALFRDQFLIKPDEKQTPKFVEKGDSGSLLVDEDNYAAGLIFAGANGSLKLRDLGLETITDDNAALVEQVNNYGVANPISEVLAKLNLELL
jgi:hypothetical protein